MLSRISAALLVSLAMTGVASARDLVIASWGGAYTDAMREAYYKPFAQAKGISFLEDTYLGGTAQLKTMTDTGDVKWDLVILEGAELQVGCDEGLLEELDWSKLGNETDLMEGSVSKCGAGNVIFATGIAYNKESTAKAPQTWADFWDTGTWPGKRGLRAGPKLNLEFALLADGVPMDQLYATLGTPEGIDRAFAKLDEIKSDLQFWEAGAQPAEWLAAGNVALAAAYNGRISNAAKEGKPLEFVWQNAQYTIDSWAIPTNAPNKELALEFIAFVNGVEPQVAYTSQIAFGTTNIKALDLITPENAAILPMGKNIAGAFRSDEAFWADNIDQLTERWNNWIAR